MFSGRSFILLFYILFIIFIASTIRSAFGFGESLIAVPFLALIIPINVAVPLAVLLSITIAAVVVIFDWKHIHIGSAKSLLISTVFGLPVGFLILKYGDEKIIKICLGIIIILFSMFSLWKKNISISENSNRSWLYSCGFLAGVLGGAYGMNGPPLAVYGSFKGWSPQHFRATLHAYFLPASLFGLVGFWNLGLLTTQVYDYYLMSLLVTIPAIFLGKKLNTFLPEEIFKKSVFVALIGVGVVLFYH